MKYLLILGTLFCISKGFSQHNNNWFFGINAGVNFNLPTPSFNLNGQTNNFEGTTSLSDNNGNLLFYTNGVTIWDKNHNIMPNGNGLMGHSSSSQSALIVPFLNDTNKYYIFTVTDWMHLIGELRYSIVDLSLNFGNGDIESSTKNTLLKTNVTEKLVAAKNDCNVWVMTHERDNNKFVAFEITNNGISSPVHSYSGSSHINISGANTNWTGVMMVAPNNNKIALATLTGIIELFDFDNNNGIISNPINIPITTYTSSNSTAYGVCFSPNSNILYVGEGNSANFPNNDIFQYDISSGIELNILSSKTLIGHPEMHLNIVFSFQIGPDNKIYVSRRNRTYLGVIQNPNILGMACTYNDDGLFLGGYPHTGYSGLQNLVLFPNNKYPIVTNYEDFTLCNNDTVEINLTNTNSTYLWQDNSTDSSFSITQPGTYWVEIANGCGITKDTFNIFPNTQVDLKNDTSICDSSYLLNVTNLNSTYLWQDNSTDSTFLVTNNGEYWIESTNNCGVSSDTVNIDFLSIPEVNLGNDTTICSMEELILNAFNTNSTYLWQDNSTDSIFLVTNNGKYWVKSTNKCGVSLDTVNINFLSIPDVNLGNDTSICNIEELILSAFNTNSTYLWQDNSTDSTFSVTNDGKYWVEVTNSCGFSKSEIEIRINNCDCFIGIPSAFSPNNDGVNDEFSIISTCEFKTFSLYIYDRKGELVYFTNEYGKWNGYYKSKKYPISTYVFMLEYSFSDGYSKKINGNLTIVK